MWYPNRDPSRDPDLGKLHYGVLVDEDWSWTTRQPQKGEQRPYSRALKRVIGKNPELLSSLFRALATGDVTSIRVAQDAIADAVLSKRSTWFRSDRGARQKIDARIRDLALADPMTVLATLHE